MTGLEAKISVKDGIILMMLLWGNTMRCSPSIYYGTLKSGNTSNFVLKVLKTRLSYSKVYSMHYDSDNPVEIPLFMFLSLAEQISKKHTKRG